MTLHFVFDTEKLFPRFGLQLQLSRHRIMIERDAGRSHSWSRCVAGLTLLLAARPLVAQTARDSASLLREVVETVGDLAIPETYLHGIFLHSASHATRWSTRVIASIRASYPSVDRPIRDTVHAIHFTVGEPAFHGDTAIVELQRTECRVTQDYLNYYGSSQLLQFVRTGTGWRHVPTRKADAYDSHCGPGHSPHASRNRHVMNEVLSPVSGRR